MCAAFPNDLLLCYSSDAHTQKLHPQGHREHESRGLIPLTERAMQPLPQKQEEWTLAFSMQ